jgi:hypothetical protein
VDDQEEMNVPQRIIGQIIGHGVFGQTKKLAFSLDIVFPPVADDNQPQRFIPFKRQCLTR